MAICRKSCVTNGHSDNLWQPRTRDVNEVINGFNSPGSRLIGVKLNFRMHFGRERGFDELFTNYFVRKIRHLCTEEIFFFVYATNCRGLAIGIRLISMLILAKFYRRYSAICFSDRGPGRYRRPIQRIFVLSVNFHFKISGTDDESIRN